MHGRMHNQHGVPQITSGQDATEQGKVLCVFACVGSLAVKHNAKGRFQQCCELWQWLWLRCSC